LMHNTHKILALFALTLLAAASFTSIVSAQYYPVSWDSVTVTSNIPDAGTVSPGTGQYNYGDSIVFSETPNKGYLFSGWYVDGVYEGQLANITLLITQEYILEAVFSVELVTLTIASNPINAGILTPGVGVWNYTSSDTVTVRESPNSGFTFSGWSLDGAYEGAGTGITVSMLTNHQLVAFFAGSSKNSTSPPPAPPTLPTPNIVMYCQSSATSSGYNVVIQGAVKCNGASLPNAGIMLSYSATNGFNWRELSYVVTGTDGSFSCTWMPSASGYYAVEATLIGTDNYLSVSRTINFAVAPLNDQNQSSFSVTSNSTLSSLAFDSTKSQLSFTVSGPSGTYGYAQVCIPKSLMNDTSALTITSDGHTITYTALSEGSIWLVTIYYHCSTHSIVMNIAAQPTTFGGLWLLVVIIPVAVIVAVAAGLMILRRRNFDRLRNKG